MNKLNANDHDALSRAFAENVAGWTCKQFPSAICPDIEHWHDAAGALVMFGGVKRFTRSADAVLPWLGKCAGWSAYEERENGYVRVAVTYSEDDLWPDWETYAGHRAKAPTFAHAAVIALLRANGVEVADS